MTRKIEVEVEAGRDANVKVVGRDEIGAGEKKRKRAGKGFDLLALLPCISSVVEWAKALLKR